MQDTITTVYCVCADLLRALEIGDDNQSRLSNAEIMMTPIVASLYFGGKIERAHVFLYEHGYIRARLSKSRLNRRLHRLPLEVWRTLFNLLGQVFKKHNTDNAYTVDSMPFPVCDNIRISRCRLLQGSEHHSYQIARMLKAEGVKFQLELWNEPHNFVILKMVGGEWNGKLPSPWVDHYVAMVNEAVKQVKAVDPSVHLMTDEDVWMNHYQFLAKGLDKNLDGFGIHPYWNQNSKGPEDTGIDTNTGWALPYHLTDKDRSLNSAIRRLTEEAVNKMGRTPLFWATEIDTNVGGETQITPMTPEGKVTEEAQAAYLLRTMVTAAAAGNVETVYWFSSFDGPDGAFGLRANDGTKRKSYTAFKIMTQQLGDYTYGTHLIGKEHLTIGVQAHLFKSPNGSKVVLWNIDGEGTYLAPKAQTGKLRILDVMGHDVLPLLTQEGQPYLKVSQSPIYITGLPENFTLDALGPVITGVSLPNDPNLPANAGPNLALNRPVVASDTNVSGWANGLTDGSWEANAAHTFATGACEVFPKTATIDLGKLSNLNLIRLGVPPFGSTKTVKVSLSSDGQKFTEVGSYVFSQSKEEKRSFAIDKTSARFIRITYPDHYDKEVNFPSNYAFTSELEAYSTTN